jgi:histidinol phosphatase-like enzyme
MPLMAYEQPLLTIVPAVKHVKAKGCECRKPYPGLLAIS